MKDIRRLTRWGFGSSMFLLLLVHVLKLDFNPLERNIAEYANGSFGVLVILAYISFSFGILGLAFQAYRMISGENLRLIFSFLFVLSAFSSIILGLFPPNLRGTPSSTGAIIHYQTNPIFISSIMIALSCFTARLKFEKHLERLFSSSFVLGFLTWIGLVLLIIFIRNPQYSGLFERIYFFFLWFWLMAISIRLT